MIFCVVLFRVVVVAVEQHKNLNQTEKNKVENFEMWQKVLSSVVDIIIKFMRFSFQVFS